MSIKDKIRQFQLELPTSVTLVAVSKTHPSSDILEAYEAGQRIFGESRPQELQAKYNELPKDIEWHMIGHLQTNKVKQIAPFVTLIHSVDSLRLLEVINEAALKNNRVIDVLLEVRIAQEESKSGWQEQELTEYLNQGTFSELTGVRFRGVMGIATYTEDQEVVRAEFLHLRSLFGELKARFFGEAFDTISMGMSQDYPLAIECGSTMVRVGSSIFGNRSYP